jgi:uncharacterized protein YgfB (UPF0149 family)
MQASVGYQDLTEALARVGYTEDAAEYHGTLCGALCVLPPEGIDVLRLLAAGERPELRADAAGEAALRRLREQSLTALLDSELLFAPLLPDDDADLEPRVKALAGWCEGFLYGLASRPGLDLDKCSADAREIIKDFAQFTSATAGEDPDTDLEETAYAELVEYIRVGAQLIFMELRPPPTPDPNGSTQVH